MAGVIRLFVVSEFWFYFETSLAGREGKIKAALYMDKGRLTAPLVLANISFNFQPGTLNSQNAPGDGVPIDRMVPGQVSTPRVWLGKASAGQIRDRTQHSILPT